MKQERKTFFVAATDNYKISSGTYDFLIINHNGEESDCDTISIKCKKLKTALRKVIDKINPDEESIDYEVSVTGENETTYINLHSLEKHEIRHYLS